MKGKSKFISKVIGFAAAGCLAAFVLPYTISAMNPIVQDVYTADPAPMVCSDGRLYVYTSHDEDETLGGFYTMNDWKCYSTDDMVNWTDHGTVLSYHEFEWAKENSSWAGQVVEKDGKFYYYVPINAKNGQTAIGVAVGDSPTGPFTDPLGEPLVGPAPNYIDPTVWIDDDGQAYLYWGNPDLYCVVLNDDMISYDKDYPESDNGIIRWELETNDYADLESEECKAVQAQFGTGTRLDDKGKIRRPTLYEEGPWFYKHDGHYYMIYAANGIPERIDYSMADSPLGPWEYKGMIMNDNVDGKGSGSFTNHPGIVEYKGHSYLFYHTGKLFDGNGFHRSVAVDEIFYNDDGTIEPIPFTDEGVEPVKELNPYVRVEAETFEYTNSLKAADTDPFGKYTVEKEPCSNVTGGINLCDIKNEDYICIRNVDFSQYGAVKFTACTAADAAKGVTVGKIEIYLDSLDEPIGEYEVKGGGDINTWVTDTIDIDKTKVKNVHDVYMLFTGDDASDSLFKFDYWQFTQDEIPETSAPTINQDNNNGTNPSAVNTPKQEVSITAPGKAVVKKVKNIKKNTVKVTIKRNSKASGYRITYALDRKLKKSKKTIDTKKLNVILKKLKKGKTYYISVRAYTIDSSGGRVYGKASAVKKIKIKK